MAYYAVLAAKGFVPEAALAGFGGFGSILGYHMSLRPEESDWQAIDRGMIR